MRPVHIWTLALILAIGLTGASFAAEHTKDTLAVVKANIGQGKAVIVDVREQAEWDQGHLKGALLVPLSKLQQGNDPKTINADIDKTKILYTHCKVGKRALLAADVLEKLGYDVRPLKQGTGDLLKAGFPKAE